MCDFYEVPSDHPKEKVLKMVSVMFVYFFGDSRDSCIYTCVVEGIVTAKGERGKGFVKCFLVVASSQS